MLLGGGGGRAKGTEDRLDVLLYRLGSLSPDPAPMSIGQRLRDISDAFGVNAMRSARGLYLGHKKTVSGVGELLIPDTEITPVAGRHWIIYDILVGGTVVDSKSIGWWHDVTIDTTWNDKDDYDTMHIYDGKGTLAGDATIKLAAHVTNPGEHGWAKLRHINENYETEWESTPVEWTETVSTEKELHTARWKANKGRLCLDVKCPTTSEFTVSTLSLTTVMFNVQHPANDSVSWHFWVPMVLVVGQHLDIRNLDATSGAHTVNVSGADGFD